MSVELVTGGTGMLGSALVLELLVRTNSEIHCLVRAGDKAKAERRLWDTLVLTAKDHHRERDLEQYRADTRMRAVPGDIEESGCGMTAFRASAITRIWHSAASLRYEPGFTRETSHANVNGTANVIALAQAWDADLVHVSTAYVAGTRRGVQYEVLPAPDQATNNIYERSKVLAEHLVAESGLRWRILRPSAVVANSRTLTTSFKSGLYDAAARTTRFRRQYERRYGELLRRRAPRFCGEEHAEINLVPIDHVVRNGVRAGIEGRPGTIFHLTNASAPTVREMYDAVFTHAGLRQPVFVADALELDTVDRLLANALAFHYPYTLAPKSFDRTNTAAITGHEAMEFAAPAPVLRQLLAQHTPRLPRYSSLAPRRKTAMSSEQRNLEAVQQWMTLYNNDVHGMVDESYAEHFTVTVPGVLEITDKDTFHQVEQRVVDLAPDRRFRIENSIATGDTVIVEAVLHGTDPESHTKWEIPWCAILTFEDGRIVRDHTYLDAAKWPGVAELTATLAT